MTEPKWNPMSQAFEQTMLSLAEFLLARIAEDEAVTPRRAVLPPHVWVKATPWADAYMDEPVNALVVVRPTDRIRAECQAKRRIVELHELVDNAPSPFEQNQNKQGCSCCDWDRDYGVLGTGPCATLKLLALPYADHPEYRSEWRP